MRLAHTRRVAVARDIDEQGDKPIEAVDAGEDAHARPRLEVRMPSPHSWS